MRYEVTVEIAAEPAQVWDVLVDVEGWPGWTNTMSEVRRLDEGPLALERRARIRQPKLTPAVWEVTEFEPGRGFVWQSGTPGLITVGEHWLEPLPGGGTRVTLAVRQKGWLAPVIGRLSAQLVRDYVNQEAAGLKRHCEDRARRGEAPGPE